MVNVRDRFLSLLADILQVDISYIDDKTSPEQLTEWDSLKHMILLNAIEEEFGFRFTDDEMAECTSVKSILDLLTIKNI